MVTLRLALLLLFVPLGLGCKGADCSKSTDCNQDGGESCLFSPGSGCSAQGHCEKQNTCRPTAAGPTNLCSCENQSLALQCVPSNGITDRTTNGMCSVDAGSGDGGGGDAESDDGGTEQ